MNQLLAATTVKRPLHRPTLRLEARNEEPATYAYVQALRELFGLAEDSESSAFEKAAGGTHRPRTWKRPGAVK